MSESEYLKQVSDDAVVRHLEDGSFWVLIDGHDNLAILHTSQVLDRSRDTNGYVQVLQAIILIHKPAINMLELTTRKGD